LAAGVLKYGFDHETTPSRGFLVEELASSACCATSHKHTAKPLEQQQQYH